MDIQQAILERRSVRLYTGAIVPQETLREIVNLARFAPSWANTQIARYTFITDVSLITKIADTAVKGFVYNQKTLQNAANLLVLSFEKGKSGFLDQYNLPPDPNPLRWEFFDTGLACQTFCLAAHAYGIGTCIFGVFDGDKVAEVIQLPKTETVAALVVYGYPAQTPNTPPRKEVADLCRFL